MRLQHPIHNHISSSDIATAVERHSDRGKEDVSRHFPVAKRIYCVHIVTEPMLLAVYNMNSIFERIGELAETSPDAAE